MEEFEVNGCDYRAKTQAEKKEKLLILRGFEYNINDLCKKIYKH